MRLKTFLLFFVSLQAGLGTAFGLSDNGQALMNAAKAGDVKKVETLLKIPGIWVDEADNDGETPLFFAAEKGHLEVVKLLLEKGADITTTSFGQTPFYWAAEEGNFEVASLLLEKGADVNEVDSYGRTSLYMAAEQGYFGGVTFFVKWGVDINQADGGGSTPLHMAAKHGRFEIVVFLLEQGADLNKANKYGETPFTKALERLDLGQLTTLLSMNETQAALSALSVEQKWALLEVLLGRELANSGIASVIERFEALSGVTRSEVEAMQGIHAGERPSNRGGDSQTISAQEHPWYLYKLLKDNGVEAVRAFIGGKALVGIVTVKGLTFNRIVHVVQYYQQEHADRIVFGYVNDVLMEALGIDSFSGLVFPGAGDNYPRHLNHFTLDDMPESSRTDTERFYQVVYAKAQEARVPTFGICAGAQHLVLSRGGALTKSTTRKSDIELDPFHVPHFMSLDVEARKQVLARCEAIKIKLDAFRAHSYAAVKEKMVDLALASTAEGITPMAYYRGFENIATQFHPESRYSGVSAYGDSNSKSYQTRLLDSFFELCMQHQAFLSWGKETGKERDEVLDLRDSMNARILERLRACREDAVSTASKPWNLEVDFEAIRP